MTRNMKWLTFMIACSLGSGLLAAIIFESTIAAGTFIVTMNTIAVTTADLVVDWLENVGSE